MLKTRVMTALCLLGVFLPAVFWLPPIGWAIFSGAIILVAAWEWGGLMLWTGMTRYSLAFALLITPFFIKTIGFLPFPMSYRFTAMPLPMLMMLISFALSFLFFILIIPIWLKNHWSLIGKPILSFIIGFLILSSAWYAMTFLRGTHIGWFFMVILVPWVADTFAYFFGKAFGKRKLAPNISPGKTWEGALGGSFGVFIFAAILYFYLKENFEPIARFLDEPVIILFYFFYFFILTIMSVLGDLFESLLKRQAGLKDSSQLLPGHGGVLDRIDSLISTLPASVFLIAGFFMLSILGAH